MIDEVGLPRFAGSVRRLVVFQKAALAGVNVSEFKDPRAGEAWADYGVVGLGATAMSSKFGPILEQAKGRGDDPTEASESGDRTSILAPSDSPVPPATSVTSSVLPSPAPGEPRRPGRPRGKRSDPTYEQVTAYIPRALYKQIRVALLQADESQEFSELIADLLATWLKTRNVE